MAEQNTHILDDEAPVADRDGDDSLFFAAVSTTRMPMIVSDPHRPDNPIVFANAAFQDMTGYSQAELIGHNCRFMQGPDTDQATIAELRRAIAEQRDTAVEILNYRKDGTAFWNALFLSPVFDRDGRLIYYFGSQLDVTQRRATEEALRQAQKMEAVGQLTGGVAHDFNNLLTVIQGFGDLLLNQLRQTGQLDLTRAERSLRAILTAAGRGAALTQQLLAFARKQKLQDRIVDVGEMVAELLPLFRRTAGDGVAIELRQDGKPCTTRIDAAQAQVAIGNLLLNARDAMPDGGRIVIEVGSRTVEDGDRGFGELAPGDYAMLAITDTGCGIPPAMLSRVTEPFFTTKDQGKGTGLGLSMVYGFVRQSGGVLRLYSEIDHGTTVRLFFPCQDAGPEPASTPEYGQPAPTPGASRGGEIVLLVEDQSDVGDYAEAVLGEFGYRVVRAACADEALARLDQADEIDLLFSDLIMPGGMNGVMLAREAKRRRPKLKVLLTTGYAESSIDRVDARGDAFELIGKPYRRRELAAKVRQALDGPPTADR